MSVTQGFPAALRALSAQYTFLGSLRKELAVSLLGCIPRWQYHV